MTADVVADLADGVDWLLWTICSHLDDSELPYAYDGRVEPAERIRKVPQSDAVPWARCVPFGSPETAPLNAQPKFQVDPEVNAKVYIGRCSMLELELGALAVFLDEMTPYKSPLAQRIRQLSEIDDTDQELHRLRCGDALLRRSYNIGSEHVIYVCAPHFSTKFPDASANIIAMCVRNTLKKAISAGASSVGLPLMLCEGVPYPKCEFATAVLRAVRRCLELPAIAQNIAKVFFFGMDDETYSIARRFFPRDAAEERLSGDILEPGNEFGEIVREERNIRISAGFQAEPSSTDDAGTARTNIGSSLSNFTGNCRVGSDGQLSAKDHDFTYYCRLALSLMRLPVYQEMDESKFALRLCHDVAGRPVISIDAARMPSGLSHTHAMAYTLHIAQHDLSSKFAVALLNMDHSLIAASNVCSVATQFFQVLGDERLRNLAVVYVHRSGWATRGLLYVLMAFLPDALRDSVIHVDSSQELYKYLKPRVFESRD
ncbi:ganglioside-induced differentiation-associated protein 2 [Babesia caballi]|uniref:Ganglioside-induced differentiation-associated protein 2 n=1 Tax=Babesia caballi TaxID=5871 RepID=A0AAV4M138_BABCB|nr:ganglioside-induced differentiation-associated protein 2 [Babesia caballi]